MWHLLINNNLCNEKEILRTNKIHLEKLFNVKSNINNKEPITPLFFKKKLYLRELIRSKKSKIKKGNDIMYKKLNSVANCSSPYSKNRNIPKYYPAFNANKNNFSRIQREKTISLENKSFYERFAKRKSNYPIKDFLKKSIYEEYIKYNISKTKFLPKVTLKLCTFKEFRSNLMKEINKFKVNSENTKEINISNISNSKRFKKNLSNINLVNYNNNFQSDLYKKVICSNKKLKRCQSVKCRTFNKITYDF